MRRSVAANPLGEEKGSAPSRGVTPARIAVISALAIAVIALAIVFLSGGGGHKYTLVFQNAGQLVPDNQVLIGGSPVGSVESIDLSDDNLAEVHVEVDQELHEGTTAVIRATSLSGVANHYVSISPGPNSSPALGDGAELGLASTTTPVDIDQLFNTFPPSVRRGLADFIKGNAEIYSGQGENANDAYKYFGPALNRVTAFAGELNADQRLLEQFVVSSAKLSTTVAARGEQLSSAIANANTAFGAVATQNVALDQTLQRLPPVMRQANTTFVNLRAALDDLDPLLATAKTSTKNLAPWLAELRPVIAKFIPVTRNLRLTVARPGKANDAGELLAVLPAVQSQAAKTFPHAEDAIVAFQPDLNDFRAYTPDFFNAIGKLGAAAGYYDGNGHYVRASASAQNLFADEGGTLEPITQVGTVRLLSARQPLPGAPVPGGRRRPAADGSNPFIEPAVRRQQRQEHRMQPGRRAPRTMIRRLIPAALLVVAVLAVVLLVSGGGDSGGYRIRAIFDNGAFMVNGEQVRIAGANVGTIESVDVTRPGETVKYEDGEPVSVPGKAVIVMEITDPSFQDFRSDATCLIRPQSLIGEKFVDCRPTLPRAPGSPLPPPLEGDRRRPAGRRRAPAAAGQQRHQRRPGPDQRHPDAALRAALPLDLQRTRAPASPVAARTSKSWSSAPTRCCATSTACSGSSPTSATSWPSWRATRTRSSARSRASAPTSPASSPTPAPPPKPAPNAAPSWKSRCASSPSS